MTEPTTAPTAQQVFDTRGFSRAVGAFALSAAGARAQVGAILEHRDGLVLVDTPQGLGLPTGIRLEPASDAAPFINSRRLVINECLHLWSNP